jgi:pimeloyl-ACP methyl ester carboxylesterase
MNPALRGGLFFANGFPGLVPLVLGPAGLFIRERPQNFVGILKRLATGPDKELLQDENVASLVAASYAEAFRQGNRGPSRDVVLYSHKWGFSLRQIQIPVLLWQGEADTVVPAYMGRYLAAAIPHARPRFFKNEGHLSLIVRHLETFLDQLLQ